MNVDFDLWTFSEMHHLIIGEVLLYNSATFYRDLAIERCAESKDNSAFDLRPEAIRIHCLATICRRCDATNLQSSVPAHFNLGDVHDDGPEAFDDRDPPPMAMRQRRAPVRFFRGEIEGGKVARLVL